MAKDCGRLIVKKGRNGTRDTELAVLPDGLLNTIKRHFPQVVTRLIHLLGERLLGQYRRSYARSETLLDNHLPVDNQIFGGSNLGTVAIIPASEDVPVSNFSFELSLALHAIGPTLLLTSSLVRSRLGSSAMDSMNEYRLSSWLGQQEDLHRIVLYQADTLMSAWTKRCIRQELFTNPNCEQLAFNERTAKEGLTPETLALGTLYDGQLTLSTQLIKPDYYVIPLTDAAPQFLWKLTPFTLMNQFC
ncbi:Patatin-like phospholipase domain-containing protein 7 [Stylophora pistillata]|uniref:Patatin-like phospholipase domain-containing protein 7 n=1 Tax=Stylophora pistillata TaxID=50429 RepID=A0A2B4RY79_STYPI|nr:Patatin-like phospholipase domain-containing protein 7 [Stylophora pistillata]